MPAKISQTQGMEFQLTRNELRFARIGAQVNRRQFLQNAGAAALAGPLALRAENPVVQAVIHISPSGNCGAARLHDLRR